MSSHCANCYKTEDEIGGALKSCAKCHQAKYCSRECQRADWKEHKLQCTTNAGLPNTGRGANNRNQLPCGLDKPFHRLKNKTWLHDRPEEEVFGLLIDVYRMKMEDNYKFEGEIDNDSIYSGIASSERGFRRFLRKVKTKPCLLPSWWSSEKENACIAFGLKGGQSAPLRCAVEKSDIVDKYQNPLFPMQLRMFAEQVYGTGPMGHSGAGMLEAQMMVENGGMDGMFSAHLSFG